MVASFALTLALVQSTFLVDDDGASGADFTDLPAAVQAAEPGDVILVALGSYSAFTLNEGVTIFGERGPGGVEVEGGSLVEGVPAGQRAVLAGLEMPTLVVRDCAGTVVLDRLRVVDDEGAGPAALQVRQSADVRVSRSHVEGRDHQHGDSAILVDGSRLEVAQSKAFGGEGFSSNCGSGDPGGHGIHHLGQGDLHVAATELRGGEGGGSEYCGFDLNVPAGNGGDGIRSAGGQILLTGRRHLIQGGQGGIGPDCEFDGFGGSGVRLGGVGEVRHSQVAVRRSDTVFCTSAGPAFSLCCGSPEIEPRLPDPALTVRGGGMLGAPVAFAVGGPPGSEVVLHLGEQPVLVDTPSVQVPQLVQPDVTLPVDPISSNGRTALVIDAPAVPTGTTLHAQAELLLPDGSTRRTNSIALVVR